jgi:hypothetical protein
MKYALLIYDDESSQGEGEDFTPWIDYTQALIDAGAMRGGEALEPTATATTVRLDAGKVVTTDGPFAETKEQLGGFYLVECADLDEAVAWAARIPSAGRGPVEIRPVMPVET